MNASTIITVYKETTGGLGNTHLVNFMVPLYIVIQVLGYLVPCILALGVNAGLILNLLINGLRRHTLTSSWGSDEASRMTLVLVVILSANVFCVMTPGLLILDHAIREGDKGTSMNPTWHFLFHDFQAILVLNIIEFFGYYVMSSKFRETF